MNQKKEVTIPTTTLVGTPISGSCVREKDEVVVRAVRDNGAWTMCGFTVEKITRDARGAWISGSGVRFRHNEDEETTVWYLIKRPDPDEALITQLRKDLMEDHYLLSYLVADRLARVALATIRNFEEEM